LRRDSVIGGVEPLAPRSITYSRFAVHTIFIFSFFINLMSSLSIPIKHILPQLCHPTIRMCEYYSFNKSKIFFSIRR